MDLNSAIEAQGYNSGEEIIMSEDADDYVGLNEYSSSNITSKVTTIAGSVLNSIVNTMSDGILNSGNDKVIGNYKFVFDNGNNRDSSNEEIMAEMNQLILTISKSSQV